MKQLSWCTMTLFSIVVLQIPINNNAEHANIFLRGATTTTSTPMSEPCTLIGTDTEYETGQHDFVWQCELLDPINDSEGGLILPIEGYTISKHATDDNGQPLVSGHSTMFASDMQIKNSTTNDGSSRSFIHVPSGVVPTFSTPDDERRKRNKYRRLATTTGVKYVLVVRIIGRDTSTSSSALRLSDAVFGTRGDSLNMASQYAACSYNKLRFLPGTQPAGATLPVNHGVVEVRINNRIRGARSDNILYAAYIELVRNGFSFPQDYDHVMFCIPPGTQGGWGAYAYVDHWASIYNDNWCTYVSAQMHEIGHNLNLDHSGERNLEYDDQSGMMGYSYRSDNSPKMCFNGPKSWQLGWYSDRHATVNPLESCWSGDIVGLADYGRSTNRNEVVVLKINSSSRTDLYVNFNRRIGINSLTQEGRNQVLVTSQGGEGRRFSESRLLAKLSIGSSYTVFNYDGSGEQVRIYVDQLTVRGSYIVARVIVSSAACLMRSSSSSSSATSTSGMVGSSTIRSSSLFTTDSIAASQTGVLAEEEIPSLDPTIEPTTLPSSLPTDTPTSEPSFVPTTIPTSEPSFVPTTIPTEGPTIGPTFGPTALPTSTPTFQPTTTTSSPTNDIMCKDVDYSISYRSTNAKLCHRFNQDVCQKPYEGGEGFVFELCQATCAQYDQVINHPDWINCTITQASHTSMPPPADPVCVDVNYGIRYINSKQCSELNQQACKRKSIEGKFLFEYCPERCSRYNAVLNHPHWINCTSTSP